MPAGLLPQLRQRRARAGRGRGVRRQRAGVLHLRDQRLHRRHPRVHGLVHLRLQRVRRQHGRRCAERVAGVEVVELLPQVIDWLKNDLVPLSCELRDERRLVITPGDVFRRLREPADALFDVILIDVDHSPEEHLGEENVSFYTAPGLQKARRHLAADGILAVWSYAESTPFADALRAVFEQVRVEPIKHHNHLVDEHHTDWLFFARG